VRFCSQHGATKTAATVADEVRRRRDRETVTLPIEAISPPLVAHLAADLLGLDPRIRELGTASLTNSGPIITRHESPR
jgi:hypothetical protein